MTPAWEQRVEQVDDTGQQTEDLNEPVYGQSDGLGGAAGPRPIQQVETQVLVDGEPVTVTDAARQQPGETPAEAIARARRQLREDAREIRDDAWDQVHHDEEPDEQVTAH